MGHLSTFSVLLPLLVGLFLFRTLDTNGRLILLLVAASTVSQMVSVFYDTNTPGRNLFYNSYTIADAAIVGYIFWLNTEVKIIRKLIAVMCIGEITLMIIGFTISGITSSFKTQYVCVNCIVQTILVLSYFYQAYIVGYIEHIAKSRMFWLCLGLLIYAPINYFYFVFYHGIKSVKQREIFDMGELHSFLNMSMYILLTVALLIDLIHKPKPQHDIPYTKY